MTAKIVSNVEEDHKEKAACASDIILELQYHP